MCNNNYILVGNENKSKLVFDYKNSFVVAIICKQTIN